MGTSFNRASFDILNEQGYILVLNERYQPGKTREIAARFKLQKITFRRHH